MVLSRATVVLLTVLELDGATLTTPTPAHARTRGSAPGSLTTPGPTRPVPRPHHQPMSAMSQPMFPLPRPLPSLLPSTPSQLIIINIPLVEDTKEDSKAFPTLEPFSHLVNSSPSLPT